MLFVSVTFPSVVNNPPIITEDEFAVIFPAVNIVPENLVPAPKVTKLIAPGVINSQ